jgi:hypothetical protein
MGSSAIAHGDEGRCSACVDRHPEGRVSRPADGTTHRREQVAGDVEILPATFAAPEAPPARAEIPPTVTPNDVWLALPHQQRMQFGGCFSEMLLRAVRRQSDATR